MKIEEIKKRKEKFKEFEKRIRRRSKNVEKIKKMVI